MKSCSTIRYPSANPVGLARVRRLPAVSVASVVLLWAVCQNACLAQWTADGTTEPGTPLSLPDINVVTVDHARMEPGWTLFNLIRWHQQRPDVNFGAIVVVDEHGEIQWGYHALHAIHVVKILQNGRLIYGFGNRADGLIEVDWDGQIVNRWEAARLGRNVSPGAIAVDVDSFHHDVTELENGNLLALSTKVHEVERYYDRSYDKGKRIYGANLVADEIIEMTRSGEIVRRWSLYDVLDPFRIGYGSLDTFWDKRGYEKVDNGTMDWSHCNCVTYDAASDCLIVSVRHQDAVIKLRRSSGELVWILGTPRQWRGASAKKLLRPVGGLSWQYHQHAVELTPRGTLLMFDNGNYQNVPFRDRLPAPENRSRAVEFKIDEQECTVEQVWEYRGAPDDHFYSTFFGDVDTLPITGNILITNGGETRDTAGLSTDIPPGQEQFAEIFEVTYGEQSEKVFELRVSAKESEPDVGWSIYRAQRIPKIPSLAN